MCLRSIVFGLLFLIYGGIADECDKIPGSEGWCTWMTKTYARWDAPQQFQEKEMTCAALAVGDAIEFAFSKKDDHRYLISKQLLLDCFCKPNVLRILLDIKMAISNYDQDGRTNVEALPILAEDKYEPYTGKIGECQARRYERFWLPRPRAITYTTVSGSVIHDLPGLLSMIRRSPLIIRLPVRKNLRDFRMESINDITQAYELFTDTSQELLPEIGHAFFVVGFFQDPKKMNGPSYLIVSSHWKDWGQMGYGLMKVTNKDFPTLSEEVYTVEATGEGN